MSVHPVLRDDNLILALPTSVVSDTKCHFKKRSDKATWVIPKLLSLDTRVHFKT